MKLKAPFPWFGGKSLAAASVWAALGDVSNFIEPFAGSAAVLLARPHPPRIETLNDADCYVANFWRATSCDPEAVAEYADSPVNECDLHARHRWLVLSPAAADFRERMRNDPDYCDPKVAGWWCWGLCCWIGSGWCQTGTTAESEKIPRLNGARTGNGYYGGLGVHLDKIPEKMPLSARPTGNNQGGNYRGVHADPSDSVAGRRPQLADAYARGRGVHGNDSAGTCEQRRAWLLDWFGRLRDRLRTVRVCCGDWLRICDSASVTTRLGTTGIFFDPPYSAEAGRAKDLYGVDCGKVAHDVRAYCLERGGNPIMRLVLAGYEGEGHEELERHGWRSVAWKSHGGYGNRTERGKANSSRERLWLSPHCLCPRPGRPTATLPGFGEDEE